MKTLFITALILASAVFSNAQTVLGSHTGDRFTYDFWFQNNNPNRVVHGLSHATDLLPTHIMPTNMATDLEVEAAIDALPKKLFSLTNTVSATLTNYTPFGEAESRMQAGDVFRITASGYINAEVGGKLLLVAGSSAIEFDLGDQLGYWRFNGTATVRPSGFALEGVVQCGNTTLIHSGVVNHDITDLYGFSLQGKIYVETGFADYIDCSTLVIEKL